jgi:hypothetical protein
MSIHVRSGGSSGGGVSWRRFVGSVGEENVPIVDNDESLIWSFSRQSVTCCNNNNDQARHRRRFIPRYNHTNRLIAVRRPSQCPPVRPSKTTQFPKQPSSFGWNEKKHYGRADLSSAFEVWGPKVDSIVIPVTHVISRQNHEDDGRFVSKTEDSLARSSLPAPDGAKFIDCSCIMIDQ